MLDIDQREMFCIYLFPGNQQNRKVGQGVKQKERCFMSFLNIDFVAYLLISFNLIGVQKGYSVPC